MMVDRHVWQITLIYYSQGMQWVPVSSLFMLGFLFLWDLALDFDKAWLSADRVVFDSLMYKLYLRSLTIFSSALVSGLPFTFVPALLLMQLTIVTNSAAYSL